MYSFQSKMFISQTKQIYQHFPWVIQSANFIWFCAFVIGRNQDLLHVKLQKLKAEK